MPIDPRDFAARVSTECATAAARLVALQATLGDEVSGHSVTPRMLADVQSLDAVCQILSDLGVIFARLAQDGPSRCGPRGIPEIAIGDARQTSLRGRLIGQEAQAGGEDVVLF